MFEITIMKYTIIGIIIYLTIAFVLFAIRPKSKLIRYGDNTSRMNERFITAIVCICTVLLCVLPMGLSPYHNGEKPKQRDQYERMAESLLAGHLYLDLEVSDKLKALDNPYDCEARDAAGLVVEEDYYWDRAFYNNHYYMYFGVVPVVLVFLPFKLITGMSLTTYHATQLFTALFIVGLFYILDFLRQRFFNRFNYAAYLFLSAGFTLTSVWGIVATPALYCTAISSGLCMEIWSLVFFFRAVFNDRSENYSIINATIGALLGALTFGCRPPVALANILVLPLVVQFFKIRGLSVKLLLKTSIAVIPYAIIGILLMMYNYYRFDSPLEFGQTYQLTMANQLSYGNLLSRISVKRIMSYMAEFFVNPPTSGYIIGYGILFAFPTYIVSIVTGARRETVKYLAEKKILGFTICLAIAIVVIVVFQSVGAPAAFIRYRMDFLWLLSILSFILIGSTYDKIEKRNMYSTVICFCSFFCFCVSIACFLYPYDTNFADVFWVYLREDLKHIFSLNLY